jgi:type II secretory pathway pseudopilin PulG
MGMKKLKKILKNSKSNKAFSIIEIMIVLLLMSALGMGVMNFMRQNQANLKTSDISDEIRTAASSVNKLLKNDLSQVVYLNVSCADNQANTQSTVACSDIKIRSGITPLPGVDKTDVTALTSFGIPANLSADPATLTK